MSTVNPEELRIETKDFFKLTLQEAAEVLNEGLKYNYAEVSVTVEDCPDLTQSPFKLANVGLNGKPRLVEVGGGLSNTGRFVDCTEIYDLTDIPSIVELESAFVIGASITYHTILGANPEAVINFNISNGQVNQKSQVCKLGETEGSHVLEKLPTHETRYSFLGNLFVSEGKPGPVLKIHVRKRTGDDSFVKSIRKVLKDKYEKNVLALGGTFLIREGQVRQHLIPEFTNDPLVFNRFKFFTMSAPLTVVGILATGDYDLELRHFHFHSFNDHGDAGHYRKDTKPETIEYEGYFNIAECVYRIDRLNTTYSWPMKF